MAPLSVALRRRFPVVVLGVLAFAALLHARALVALVSSALAPPFALAAVDPTPPALADSHHAISADAILARNPFDSETGSLLAVAQPSGMAPPASCNGVKVTAIVASSDPEWSFASLTLDGAAKPVLRRRGDEVVFIGYDRVWLTRGGGICWAKMFDHARTPQPASPQPHAKPNDTLLYGITKTGGTSYAIDRSVRDTVFGDASEIMKSLVVRPEKQGDEVVGIRLVGVRPDSVLGAIGLEGGDVLRSVNGYELTAPEKLLDAYAHLATATKLRVVITRGGRLLELDYEIK
jgi:general secretion pathway protein C